MDAREAKREACWRASLLIDTAMGAGWPFNPPEDGAPVTGGDLSNLAPDDEKRVSHALYALIRELERRASPPQDGEGGAGA